MTLTLCSTPWAADMEKSALLMHQVADGDRPDRDLSDIDGLQVCLLDV